MQAENSSRTFKIHFALLNDKSKVLAAGFGDLSEKESNVFVCSDVSDETLARFVEWAYRNEYTVDPDNMFNYVTVYDMARAGGLDVAPANSYSPKTDDHPLFAHLMIYIFADTYMITGLKTVAFEKISIYLKVLGVNLRSNYIEVIVAVLTTAFARLHENDPLLDWMAYYAAWSVHALRMNPAFMDLVKSSPAVCARIITAMDPMGTPPWASYILRERMPEYMRGGFDVMYETAW